MPSSEILTRVRAGQPLNHIPVVDLHAHLAGASDYYYIPYSDPDDVVAYLDRYGVAHSLNFAITINSDPAPGNRHVYEAARRHPERLSALTMLHAQFPEDWPALLREGHAAGTRGIKLIAAYQGARDDAMDWSPAFDVAHDKPWMVLSHSWGAPATLERWAKNYPGLIFICGHATGLYREVVSAYDNVYLSTCAAFCAGRHGRIEALVNQMPVEKILHGSDALDLDLGTSIGPIAYADISEQAKEKILGGNAVTLMKRLGWNLALTGASSAG